jgi:hypothetical protein
LKRVCWDVKLVLTHSFTHSLIYSVTHSLIHSLFKGKGFYLYPKDAKKGAKKEVNPEMLALLDEYRKKTGWIKGAEVSVEDIQMRLISRFVNEVRLPLLAHIMTHSLTYLLTLS